MTDTTTKRIQTLDIVRGVAVMGILAMNIVAFAMIPQAYLNPLAYGTESAADLASWVFSFVFIDGKMRGLFSFLFGASMLLVIQLASKSGDSAKRVTFARQLWLLVFGMIHYYFIWSGDILIGYALIGMLAWLFRNKEPRALIRWGIFLVIVQMLIMGGSAAYAHMLSAEIATGNASPEKLKEWAEFSRDFVANPAVLSQEMARYLGPWTGIVEHQLTENAAMPLFFTFLFGWETLAFSAFGLDALNRRYLVGG